MRPHVFDVQTNHKDQPLSCCCCPEIDICVIYWVFFPFSGPDLPSWIPGMCRHRHHLHRPHAPSRVLPRVLSLLRQLRWEDVPEADIVHPLSQENALLEFIPHHNRHPVSVSNTHTHYSMHLWWSDNIAPVQHWEHLHVPKQQRPQREHRPGSAESQQDYKQHPHLPQRRASGKGANVWSPSIRTGFLWTFLQVVGVIE